MTAWLGLGSIAVGGYMFFNADRTQLALADVANGFSEIVLALLGLFGTALLWLGLIRVSL